MLNRVVTNGNIIDIGTSDNDGSYIINVPGKVRVRIGTDGKVTVNELRLDNLGVKLSNIFEEISEILNTIITDTGSTASTSELDGLIDEINYGD